MKKTKAFIPILAMLVVNQVVIAQTVLFEKVLNGNIPIELMSDGKWREVPELATFMVVDGNFVRVYENKTWYYSQLFNEFGNYLWERSNLDVTHFQNGDTLREVKTQEDWFDALNNNHPAYIRTQYEKLYNFHALALQDPRNLCPTGSYLPSEGAWDDLINHFGGPDKAGEQMKISYANNWENDINGKKQYTEQELDASFNGSMLAPLQVSLTSPPPTNYLFNIGETIFWSNTVDANENAVVYKLTSRTNTVEKILDQEKASGYAIRCIRHKK